MKKFVCLLLILMFTLLLAGMCLAETDEYKGEQNSIQSQNVGLTDNEVPLGLPPTGGIPVELFYGAGGVCIVAAAFIFRKKKK